MAKWMNQCGYKVRASRLLDPGKGDYKIPGLLHGLGNGIWKYKGFGLTWIITRTGILDRTKPQLASDYLEGTE